MGDVNITLANGRLGGTLQTNDGVCGMILTGAPEGDYAVGTPILIKSMADLAAAGITNTGNAFAYRQVKEFYDEAGKGASLYLMLLADTVPLAVMADATILIYAQGKIKILGIMCNDAAVYDEEDFLATTGINDDVHELLTGIKGVADEYFAAQKPFRAIIGGTSFSGTPGDLTDLTTGTTNNRVGVVIGDTKTGRGACLGMLLGAMAKLPVMRKVSRVRNGQLTNSEAWLSAYQLEAVPDDGAEIAARGYITWKTYPNVAGYYFSGDDTASATTDDYHSLARGRVIDKVHILAYTTFVQEVDDEVFVVEGKLEAGYCKTLSQKIENQINSTMTANKEISSVTCIIDPAQDIISTNTLNVQLSIVPVGYSTIIDIELGFDNPAQ